jgi:hypothetical protein
MFNSKVVDLEEPKQDTSATASVSEPSLLTLTQVSRRLRISEAEVCDMVSYEGLPSAGRGDDGLLFLWSDVIDWINSETVFRDRDWNDTPAESDIV